MYCLPAPKCMGMEKQQLNQLWFGSQIFFSTTSFRDYNILWSSRETEQKRYTWMCQLQPPTPAHSLGVVDYELTISIANTTANLRRGDWRSPRTLPTNED